LCGAKPPQKLRWTNGALGGDWRYGDFTKIVSVTWCKSVVGHYALRRGWPVCQSATAGKLTMELSLRGTMVSSVM